MIGFLVSVGQIVVYFTTDWFTGTSEPGKNPDRQLFAGSERGRMIKAAVGKRSFSGSEVRDPLTIAKQLVFIGVKSSQPLPGHGVNLAGADADLPRRSLSDSRRKSGRTHSRRRCRNPQQHELAGLFRVRP
jgi:hypothetical protein